MIKSTPARFKISSLFMILGYISVGNADFASNDQKVEMLQSLKDFNQAQLGMTEPKHMIEYSPLTSQVVENMKFMKKYFELNLKNDAEDTKKGLAKQRALGEILDILRSSDEPRLNISTILFYDKTWHNTAYPNATKAYFNSELMAISFDGISHLELNNVINKWLSEKTSASSEYPWKMVNNGEKSLELSTLSFVGCWKTPKKYDIQRGPLSDERYLHHKSFRGIEQVAYVRNNEEQYEAISVPLRNGNGRAYKVVIVTSETPFSNMLVNFTAKDYETLFDEVSKPQNVALIRYIIPYLSSMTFSMDEHGVKINSNDSPRCELFTQHQPNMRNATEHIIFMAKPPFGIFVHDDVSKTVLLSAIATVMPESSLLHLSMVKPDDY